MKKTLLFVVVFPFMIACGPSAEQIAATAQKAAKDSIELATMRAEKEERNTIARQDSIAAVEQARQDSIRATEQAMQAQHAESQAQRYELEQALIGTKAELSAAKLKLQQIYEFQIGRSAVEKQNQVARQTAVIEQLKLNITKIENTLSQI